jgi:hypothetical protein
VAEAAQSGDQQTISATLMAAAQRLRTAAAQPTAAAVTLARVCGAFAVAGKVSIALDRYSGHARDAYEVGQEVSARARLALINVCGTSLIKKHALTYAGAGSELDSAWRAELHLATDEDIERIAGAMVELAVAVSDALGAVEQDDSVLPEQRAVARAALRDAEDLWAHYGGDSAGW